MRLPPSPVASEARGGGGDGGGGGGLMSASVLLYKVGRLEMRCTLYKLGEGLYCQVCEVVQSECVIAGLKKFS